MQRPAAEEGARWLAQAREDLRWASHLAREGGFHVACFPNGVPDGIPAEVFTAAAADQAVTLATEAVSLVGRLLAGAPPEAPLPDLA
ncbi:MAG: hypothetical protein AB1634_15545 [Thermodesulfobacteriota bacterium]